MQYIYIFDFTVGVMKGVDGALEYWKLTALAKCVQCISNGSGDPGGGFFLNKTLLTVQGASIRRNY